MQSSRRMARPDAKCSCWTLARFSYHRLPISDMPFCRTSVQTASTGKMENAWFKICSADDFAEVQAGLDPVGAQRIKSCVR